MLEITIVLNRFVAKNRKNDTEKTLNYRWNLDRILENTEDEIKV